MPQYWIQKGNFRGASTYGKLTGISALVSQGNILKKIKISFIGYLSLSKFSFSLDTLKKNTFFYIFTLVDN